MKPLGDYVIVQVLDEDKTTKSGIIVAGEGVSSSLIKGSVRAVGPLAGVVQVGETVLFSKYAGVEVDKNEHLLIVKISDVVAIINS